MCSCSKSKSCCCTEKSCNSHKKSCCESSYGRGCGCCPDCDCCAESCCDQTHEGHMKSHKLLEIADMAWVELLKEKIKEHIKHTDTKIDELAKIVSEANHKRWKQKMREEKHCAEHDQCCEDFEHQLCKLFSCDSGHCHTDKNHNCSTGQHHH